MIKLPYSVIGGYDMLSNKTTMYSEKKYEIEELKGLIKTHILKIDDDIKCKEDVYHVLGDGKTLLMIFEKWYMRTGSYTSLVILLSEYHDVQCADVVATGGKEGFFSLGSESDFENIGIEVLQDLGFKISVNKNEIGR